METGQINLPKTTPPKVCIQETDPKAHPRVRGRTYIEDDVISVIARIAAEQIPGVYQLGESSLRSIMSRFGRHRGIDSEVGLEEAAEMLGVSLLLCAVLHMVIDECHYASSGFQDALRRS